MREHISRVFATSLLLYPLLLLFMMHATAADPAPGDLIIPRNEGSEMGEELLPASIFPHWIHRIHFRCDACHDSLFEMKAGATEISMDLMEKGKSCAVCHDGETAFVVGFDNCAKCHATPSK